MAEKALTSLVVRSRSLEWVTVHKPGDKPAEPRSAELDPGADGKTLLAGLQADRERVSQEIREKVGRLPAPVCIGIPASWVLMRITDLPSGSPEELAGMVELQVDKFSPFPIEESSLSHEVLLERDGRCRLLLSAIRTDVINGLADALRGRQSF